MSSVKQLVESGCIASIPSKYVFTRSLDETPTLPQPEAIIPVIDFSLLTSGNAEQRTKAIKDLGKACREWGFFMIINHNVPEKLMKDMISGSQSFFDLREEEKQEYAGKALFDPIRWGTSFNATADETFFWRDYLKIHVHPHFNVNALTKPAGFSEVIQEYCKQTRELAGELLRGISKSLGLEEIYIEKKMNKESGPHELMAINLYPPCPQPDVAMGLPPHTDHGFITLLMQNELCGLQVLYNGNWVSINPFPNSFLVNIGDHMEILTNGKHKSVVHRAFVNNKATRISIGTAHGPTLDTVVSPAPEFVDYKTHPPLYRGIKYRDYMQLQQSNQLNGKSCLDRIRI
ncbi:hypothetical protein FEM48_Zijuj06G0107900 [Ziziphus jujuba var. spinosa]|uniref:Fe2OG dioxygenase domain-containing protein n=1 Tax=Ziziphus jujuba var. spinosa TaxID=714518 RepID=A0A978V8U5_ZIZJJ|nr:hypothetical protein FEM48_Zijuj06G0107900 [Ziziphus jujuba var. spinosa]